MLNSCIVCCNLTVSAISFSRSTECTVMSVAGREEGGIRGQRYSFQKMGCKSHIFWGFRCIGFAQ